MVPVFVLFRARRTDIQFSVRNVPVRPVADTLAEVSMGVREWADPFRRPSAGTTWKQPHLPKIRDSECMSNTQKNLRDPMNQWLELAGVLAAFSRWLRLSLGRHEQMSCFPETFSDVHSCVGSWPEHFRVACDLESSLRLGHVHIDRLSSIANVPLKTARAQVIHTDIISSW